RNRTVGLVQNRIDRVFDKPWQRHAGEVRGDERKNAEGKETAIAINEKLDGVRMVKNLYFLLPEAFWIRPDQLVPQGPDTRRLTMHCSCATSAHFPSMTFCMVDSSVASETLTCSIVLRSRIVTLSSAGAFSSPTVWTSTVTQNGVPTSSWRR